MKRWLSHLLIVTYLGALSWGIVSHTLKVGVGAHTAMYFLVWDMFCGWSSHSSRVHVIGEGKSGTYYELAPGPWREFKPYGPLGRRHYDVFGLYAPSIAQNVLRHTDHEEMARIFIVEESYPKMYNLPDALWAKRFEEPKVPYRYYSTMAILTGDGTTLQTGPNWLSRQSMLALTDNPRLKAETTLSQPFLAIRPYNSTNSTDQGSYSQGNSATRMGSVLGN